VAIEQGLNAAVVGAGSMGRRHLQVLSDLGIAVAGICDRRAEAAAEAAAAHGLPAGAVFGEPEAMLDATRPALVIVATTAPSHAELTCLAAEAGASHVLCEKPMATSLAACDRMLETCERTGTRLAINHQMRFMDQHLRAREVVEDPAFGGWTGVTVIAGNFGLAMNATHYFEMFRWLSGEAPASVTAWLSAEQVPNPRGPEFVDRAGCVRIETASGRRFYLDASSDQGHGLRVVYAGRAGVLVADELAGSMWLSQRRPEDRDLPTVRYGMPSTDTVVPFAPADVVGPSRAVLAALLAGDDHPDGRDGRSALATLVAAHVSDEAGHRPVRPGSDEVPRDRELPIA
jgi:predicted dehydrogenase